MIKYEVNLEIDQNIYEEFREWLRNHIQEILNLDGFMNAELYEENDPKNIKRKLTVSYGLDNLKSLQDYFEQNAVLMRNKTTNKFGDKVKSTRRILELNQAFEK